MGNLEFLEICCMYTPRYTVVYLTVYLFCKNEEIGPEELHDPLHGRVTGPCKLHEQGKMSYTGRVCGALLGYTGGYTAVYLTVYFPVNG